MKAHELMTTSVISVAPDAPLRGVAQMLLDHGISAVPVVDAGMPVGVVSEGDIVSRCCEQSRPRRDWFARLFAGGAELDELMIFQRSMQVARDVMSAPVITTVESVEAEELSRIMITHGVKRLPVVRAGRMVGIVSRADLLRAVAARGGATSAHREHEHSALTDFFLGIDHMFHRNHAPPVDGGEHSEHGDLAARGADPSSGDTEHVFTAAALRATVEHHKEEEARFRAQARAGRGDGREKPRPGTGIAGRRSHAARHGSRSLRGHRAAGRRSDEGSAHLPRAGCFLKLAIDFRRELTRLVSVFRTVRATGIVGSGIRGFGRWRDLICPSIFWKKGTDCRTKPGNDG